MTLSWRGGREWRCTKFEVNRTNIEWVTLPAAPSVSSGDLLPDVCLTSADVRADVTTKHKVCGTLLHPPSLVTTWCPDRPVQVLVGKEVFPFKIEWINLTTYETNPKTFGSYGCTGQNFFQAPKNNPPFYFPPNCHVFVYVDHTTVNWSWDLGHNSSHC